VDRSVRRAVERTSKDALVPVTPTPPISFSVQWNDPAMPPMARDRSADGSVIVSGAGSTTSEVQSLLVQRAWRLPTDAPVPEVGGIPQVQPETGEAIRVESWFDSRPGFHPELRPLRTRLAEDVATMAATVTPLRPLSDAEYGRGVATRPGEYALMAQVGAGDWQLWRGQLDAPAEGARQALAAARAIAGSGAVVDRLTELSGDEA
jgi:hypothetical protein